MREQTLGDFLRESRVSQKITLDEIENKTGISSHYLLALELDQFKIIPEEVFDSYLSQYAEIVNLDFQSLKQRFLDQTNKEQDNNEPSITQQVEEKLSKRPIPFVFPTKNEEPEQEKPEMEEFLALNRNSSEENQSHFEEEKKNQEIVANRPSLDDNIPAMEEKQTEPRRDSLLSANRQDKEVSRLSRYQDEDKKSKSILPVILLSLIALAIGAFVYFTVWPKFSNNVNVEKAKSVFFDKNKKSSNSSSKKVEKSSSPSSSEEKTVIKAEGQGNYITADIKKAKETVEVSVSLTDAESSWIALSNSDIGEAGTTLTQEEPTYTTTLPADTKEALLMLGIKDGLSVSIDGQKLDLSSLTNNDISYITLNIN
ncbi:hypothetical protein AT575_09810 [Streptococcus penaeicida]|uniref:Uncharacterized protein n=1 Tax=Streptococcus penaeicida TaxID=1765960 RepID=A0A2N8L9X2_9STRE|nr:helix-turn-helix domain-containing protein [Streptococcus penaeicida]PND46958.1 hypothetical protein AT575_09810 [Streptococcus penaeicida]